MAKEVAVARVAEADLLMKANTHADRIKSNYALGMTKQVGSTPTFFVNGVKLEVSQTYDNSGKRTVPKGSRRM